MLNEVFDISLSAWININRGKVIKISRKMWSTITESITVAELTRVQEVLELLVFASEKSANIPSYFE